MQASIRSGLAGRRPTIPLTTRRRSTPRKTHRWRTAFRSSSPQDAGSERSLSAVQYYMAGSGADRGDRGNPASSPASVLTSVELTRSPLRPMRALVALSRPLMCIQSARRCGARHYHVESYGRLRQHHCRAMDSLSRRQQPQVEYLHELPQGELHHWRHDYAGPPRSLISQARRELRISE